MANEDKPDGYVAMRKGRQVLRFVRHIDHPIEKVWAALVIPERVADWMGSAEIDPRVGGKYNITFGDDGSKAAGVIEHFDPPRLLAYTWGGAGNREHPGVIYELEPEGAGCKLTLTTQFPEKPHGDPAEAVATWHEFLLAIPPAADGIRMAWDEARRARWKSLFEPYRTMLAAAGLPSTKT